MRGMRGSCIYMERPEVLGALARLCDAAREGMGTSILDDEHLLGFFLFLFLLAHLCDAAREGMGTSILDDERLLGFFSLFFSSCSPM